MCLYCPNVVSMKFKILYLVYITFLLGGAALDGTNHAPGTTHGSYTWKRNTLQMFNLLLLEYFLHQLLNILSPGTPAFTVLLHLPSSSEFLQWSLQNPSRVRHPHAQLFLIPSSFVKTATSASQPFSRPSSPAAPGRFAGSFHTAGCFLHLERVSAFQHRLLLSFSSASRRVKRSGWTLDCKIQAGCYYLDLCLCAAWLRNPKSPVLLGFQFMMLEFEPRVFALN